MSVFETALNHAMLYEVGGHWDLNAPGARDGSIKTKAHRQANGYVNDPDDNGGETKYGVSKNANADLNIATLDWEGAKRVYYKRYWLGGSCEALPPRLATLHFDGCVNHGIGRASIFLQTAVGATADGDIGPATLRLVDQADELVTCDKICDLRTSFYHRIVLNNPSQGKYLNGWLRRIDEMREFVKLL